MTQEIQMHWLDKMAFETNLDGHTIVLDVDKDSGGDDRGPRAKGLILVAMGGCTGMGVLSTIKKMHEPITWFNMKIIGNSADQEPRKYLNFKVVYQFKKSDGLNEENVRKAVELSQTKYCAVIATLKDGHEVTWDIEYV